MEQVFVTRVGWPDQSHGDSIPTNPETRGITGANGNTLGLLWIVYGIIRLAAAVLLVICTGTATVMFGAPLTRVANPFALMNVFHLFYTAMIIVAALGGIFGLIAGLTLLAG